MAISNIIAPAIGITLSSLIIYYLNNLKTIGCECALNFKRDYIMYYSMVSILFNIVSFAVGVPNILLYYIRYPILYTIPAILFTAAVVNMVFIFQYVEEMKKINCECSESVYRDMMFVLAILQAISIGLIVLLLGQFVYAFSRFSPSNVKIFKTSYVKGIRTRAKST